MAQYADGAVLYLSVVVGGFVASHTLPDIGVDGLEGEVATQIDFCSLGGQDVALKLAVDFGLAEQVGGGIAWQHAGVVLFAIKNACMLDRPCDACPPVGGVGAVVLLGAVGIGELEDSAEGALMSAHAVEMAGGDNLVGPPAGGDLDSEGVGCAPLTAEGAGDIVGEGALSLGIVGEPGLEDFVAHGLTVEV